MRKKQRKKSGHITVRSCEGRQSVDGGEEGEKNPFFFFFPKRDVVEKVSILGKLQVRRSAMPP